MGDEGSESQWRRMATFAGRSRLFGGGCRRQLQGMQHVAHLPSKGIINKLVLANAWQALEGR
jgi:hypothetical protein